MSRTMLSLELAGKAVVVVGGGAVGTRRALALADAGASVTVVAPVIDAALEAHPDIACVAEAFADEQLDGAWLAVAATDSPDVNAAVAAAAEQRRVWCVDASAGRSSAATMPAQSRHGDILLAVGSTAEPDPQRVASIRAQLGGAIDGGAVDLRRRRHGAGTVALVGAGPGDPDLMTVAARRAVAAADVIVADRLGAAHAIEALAPACEVIDVGKRPGHHPVPQRDINALIVERALRGESVVRLKGGDPFVFGRGGEEYHACVAAGVPVTVVPGVTSALAGAAAAAIPVTQRGVSTGVHIVTGHEGIGEATVAAMADGVTVVLLMAVAALPRIAETALAAGIPGDTPVAIVESATLAQQRVTTAPLRDITVCAAETGVKPPAVIVVGKVAEPGMLASKLGETPSDVEDASGRRD